VDSDKISDYQGEDATQYENQAAEIAWHGHEIMFGLMYEFVKPDETLLDIGIGTGLSSFLFHKAGLHNLVLTTPLKCSKGASPRAFRGKSSSMICGMYRFHMRQSRSTMSYRLPC
jgi:hypothetical protein